MRWGLRIFAGVAVTVTVVLTLHPHIMPLFRKGFPAEFWPAKGQFAVIKGTEKTHPSLSSALPDDARTPFDASGRRAMVVVQNGRILFEAYGIGLSRDIKLNSFSLVMSFLGALTLKAVAIGKIASLDHPIALYLGPRAPDVRLRDALMMTSGLKSDGEPSKSFDDGRFSPLSPLAKLHVFGLDAVMPQVTVDQETVGTFWYQSAITDLLGRVLEVVHGALLNDILAEEIWRPTGAADAVRRVDSRSGSASAYCCVFARAVDWALVGHFLLANGSSGMPFLPKDVWQDFALPDLAPDKRRVGAFGNHIRHDVLDWEGESIAGPFAYMMEHKGQMVYLLPHQEAVVVRFGTEPQLLHSTLYDIFAPGEWLLQPT